MKDKHDRMLGVAREAMGNTHDYRRRRAIQYLIGLAERAVDEAEISRRVYDNYCGSDYKMCSDNSAKAISAYLLQKEG